MRDSSIRLRTWVSVGIILFVMLADQAIKFRVKTSMLLHESYRVTDWFQICFTENKGMAFGMDFIGTVFLTVFRILAVIFFCFMLSRFIRRCYPMGFIVCLSMIVAGAAGNIIDNCFYGLIFTESAPAFSSLFAGPASLVEWGDGYGEFLSGRVVDMFYFPLFTWPDWIPLVGGDVFFGAIFNFADASISCGAVALLLFYHKYLTGDSFRFDNNKSEA